MLRAVAVLLVLAACASPAPSAEPSGPASGTVEPEPSVAQSSATPSVAAATWEVLEDAPFARLEMAVTAHEG